MKRGLSNVCQWSSLTMNLCALNDKILKQQEIEKLSKSVEALKYQKWIANKEKKVQEKDSSWNFRMLSCSLCSQTTVWKIGNQQLRFTNDLLNDWDQGGNFKLFSIVGQESTV